METKPNIFCEKPWKINGFLLVLPFMVKWILADSSTIINVMEQSIMPHMCALSQRISALFKDTHVHECLPKQRKKQKLRKCPFHDIFGYIWPSLRVIENYTYLWYIFCIVSSSDNLLNLLYRKGIQTKMYLCLIHISCTLIRKRVINTKI